MSNVEKHEKRIKQIPPEQMDANELALHKARLARRRKKRTIRTFLVLGLLLIVALAVYFLMQRWSWRDYKVSAATEQEDTIASQYTELDGKIFKFSGEGAALMNQKQEVLWNIAYEEMQNPLVDVCEKTAVVYDQGNTSMSIFNETGQLGSVSTNLNIVKARVAKQGVVVAILDGGEDTWINFYASDGSLIAENQTRVDDPGYPLDVSVSEDGLMIMVAYQFVDGGETTSYVAFYNFGSVGQNQIDNIVSGYKYEGVVVPKVQYINSSTAVAFRDDGFTLYKGKQVPKEDVTVKVDKEIVSIFCDAKHIGLVFKNTNKNSKNKQYVMQVYRSNGKLKFTEEFGITYSDIRMSGGQVVMHNGSQICVFSSSGVEKFNGAVNEGAVSDFFRVGFNQYLLVLDNGLYTIKFK